MRSLTLSADGKFLLSNCSDKDPVIHLWNIDKEEIVQSYKGHSQSKYVLKCAFGGKFENYVICGSEDDMIYIWNRNTGDLLDVLKGHTDTVNNVAFSPMISNFFFSCSDDQTIKVWGTSDKLKVKVTIDNKFKSILGEFNEGGNSDNSGDEPMGVEQDDSESIGESSDSGRSLFSDEDET